VADAELGAHGAHRRVVALVEQPDVERALVPDGAGGRQRPAHHLDRLLARHDRGDERDPLTGERGQRDRVARVERRHRQGEDVDQAQGLDDGDAADQRHDQHRAPVAGPVRVVRRPEQEDQEQHLEQQGRGHQEPGPDARPATGQRLEPDAGVLRRLLQRAGELAEVGVGVAALSHVGT
jgi:hypothetical protein